MMIVIWKQSQECIYNIEIHAGLLFDYDKAHKELEELYNDYDNAMKNFSIFGDMKTIDAMDIIKK